MKQEILISSNFKISKETSLIDKNQTYDFVT
uniref:Uncharacterized protein n=1 Tax=viral metagenome TaxID=1070528 RepID=A0A6C0F5H3_9ZZZZ